MTCLVPVSVVPTAGHIGPLSAPGPGHQLTTLPSAAAAASDALLHSRIKSRPSLSPRRLSASPWRVKGWLRKRKQVTAAGRPLPTCAGPSWPAWGAKRKNFNYMESWHLRYRSGVSWYCETILYIRFVSKTVTYCGTCCYANVQNKDAKSPLAACCELWLLYWTPLNMFRRKCFCRTFQSTLSYCQARLFQTFSKME